MRARRPPWPLALLLGFGLVLSGRAAVADVSVGLGDVRATTTASATTVTGVITVGGAAATSVVASVALDGQKAPAVLGRPTSSVRRAVLLIDTSGSMGDQGMATARSAVAVYLASAPAELEVGVASFADRAGVDLAPTRDRAAVQRAVDALDARGDTSLYAGVRAAAAALGRTGDRSIVLLSDGADTVATDAARDRATVLATVRAGGIRVDVVRFRTSDPVAVATLSALSGATGGRLLAADTPAAVSSALRTLAVAPARSSVRELPFTATVPGVGPGAHRVEVTGTVGGTAFRFVRQVVVAAPSSSTSSSTPSALPSSPAAGSVEGRSSTAPRVGPITLTDRVPLIAAGLLALALFVLLSALLLPRLRSDRDRRVAAIESYVAGGAAADVGVAGAAGAHGAPGVIAAQLLEIGDRVMKDRRSTSRTMALIERADLPLRSGEWFVLRAVAVVVGAAVGLVVAGPARTVGLVAGVCLGLTVMPLGLRLAASRRARAFESQLPQILLLVATSLRSGFGLPQSLEAIARDSADPAGKEFSRALAETRIGTDISDALERVAVRMQSTSMHWTVLAIRIQREVGGNLAETLRTTAGTLREREALSRQVSALSAEGRLSAYILIALPVFIFFYMLRANYDYVSLLWTTKAGLVMSVAGLVALGTGILWMRQVVKVEV